MQVLRRTELVHRRQHSTTYKAYTTHDVARYPVFIFVESAYSSVITLSLEHSLSFTVDKVLGVLRYPRYIRIKEGTTLNMVHNCIEALRVQH